MSRPIEELTDEELVQKAIALSLITEQEDEKRRQERYGTLEQSKPSGTSLIARPRPQPRSTVDQKCATLPAPSSPRAGRHGQPPVPPRPPSASYQHLQHLPQQQRTSQLRQPDFNPSVPPRPGSSTSVGSGSSGSPPLISFSPSVLPKKMELFDFDLSSLDPLNAPSSSTNCTQPNQAQIQAQARHRAQAQPHPQSQRSQTLQHNPRSQCSQMHPQQSQIQHAQAQQQQHQQHTRDILSGKLNQHSSGFGSQVIASSSSAPSSTTNSTITRSAPASPKKQLSLAPSPPPLSLPSPTGRSLTPTPPNPFPRRADDPFYVKEQGRFHKVPSDPNFSMTYRSSMEETNMNWAQAREKLSPLASTSDIDVEDHGAVAKAPAPGPVETPPDGSNSGDLMIFADDKFDDLELSLESFDPLFVAKLSQNEKIDSLGLFTNPYNKFERKETPNPFPDINPVETQKILDRMSPEKQPAYKHYNKLDLDDQEEGSRHTESPDKEVAVRLLNLILYKSKMEHMAQWFR